MGFTDTAHSLAARQLASYGDLNAMINTPPQSMMLPADLPSKYVTAIRALGCRFGSRISLPSYCRLV